jgi:hypothetical protein
MEQLLTSVYKDDAVNASGINMSHQYCTHSCVIEDYLQDLSFRREASFTPYRRLEEFT